MLVDDDFKHLENPLNLRYNDTSGLNTTNRIELLEFDEYYSKEVDQKISQYARAENFLHNLGGVLHSLRKPISKTKDIHNDSQINKEIKYHKKKLKRKVVKKKHLAYLFENQNLNELTHKLMEIEVELDLIPFNSQNQSKTKNFVPFADHATKHPSFLDHKSGDRLISMSKIKKLEKLHTILKILSMNLNLIITRK